MNLREPLRAVVDAEGRLVLPAQTVAKLGLTTGSAVPLDVGPDWVRVRRPVEHLAKVYLEPTSRCNLKCRTCMRRTWQEPLGDMSEDTFAAVLDGLDGLGVSGGASGGLQGPSDAGAPSSPPTVIFGGLGEPLVHPHIIDMVQRVKSIGVPRVELITNGCLLTPETSRRLIAAGLDVLWISLDGIRPESYSDVRLGAMLPQILENLQGFKEIRREIQIAQLTPQEQRRFKAGVAGWHDSWRLPEPYPTLGIVFVALKRNVADLPEVIDRAYKLGARRFIVSNVLPYSAEMAEEALYRDRLDISPFPTLWNDRLRLTQMDIDQTTRRVLSAAVHSYQTGLAESDVSNVTRRCPFVEAGSAAIDWQGGVSPCLSLLHAHDEVFDDRPRRVHAHRVGDVTRNSLAEIWSDPDYVAFRRRVQAFEFGPCFSCKRCALPLENEADCLEETFPVCGACLWSQGLVRCP